MNISNNFNRTTDSDSIIQKGKNRLNNVMLKDVGFEYGVDILEISQDGYEIRRLIEDKSAEFIDFIKNNTVDVRQSKIEAVSRNLTDGLYDRQETFEKLANRLSGRV